MNKKKIAISIDNNILDIVDSYIDNSTIRSRSQAVELLIKKSIKEQPVTEAVILINPKFSELLLRKFNDSVLLTEHINFLYNNGIKKIFIISKINDKLNNFINGIKFIDIQFINQEYPDGTANALKLVSGLVKNNFIVINGDTYNNFNLKNMVKEHISSEKVATIGLISSSEPEKFGSVTLNGNSIVSFSEKSKTHSNIINAGIYIFNKNVFSFLSKKVSSLEKELFPILALKNNLNGFFTYGNYYHFEK